VKQAKKILGATKGYHPDSGNQNKNKNNELPRLE
jgi:hypothetical protein